MYFERTDRHFFIFCLHHGHHTIVIFSKTGRDPKIQGNLRDQRSLRASVPESTQLVRHEVVPATSPRSLTVGPLVARRHTLPLSLLPRVRRCRRILSQSYNERTMSELRTPERSSGC